MRGDQTIRQWKIIRFLMSSKTGKTVQKVINHIGSDCSERTVYRDFEVLQIAGFPLYNYKTNSLMNKKNWVMKWKLLKDDFWGED